MTSRARFLLVLALSSGLVTCQNLGPLGSLGPLGPFGGGGGGGVSPLTDPYQPRLIENLGDHQHPISSNSPLAQKYFDQGMILTFGFNHESAIDAFRAAAQIDPGCAICYWGIGFALGPNINAPMGPDAARLAQAAVGEARARAATADDKERAYIDALSARYSADPNANRAALDRAFADAMRLLHQRYPDDNDAATLFAESLMDLHPWNYYDDDGKAREGTEEALATLEQVLERDPKHPGANHYLIHVAEEFWPEKAEAAADRLRGVAPAAGHLVHMPSHIYWRVGRYQDAIDVNEAAAAADVALFAWCRSPEAYAAGYYNHNVHFLWAASAAQGRRDGALTAARRLAGNIPPSSIQTYPFLEDFVVIPMLTMARFGMWDAVLGEPRPPADWGYTTGVWHYARGLAYTRKGEPANAHAELAALEAITLKPAVMNAGFDVAGGTAGQRLMIGLHQLRGELLAQQGRQDEAIAEMEKAVAAQDAMNYIEPPAWYMPTRQALGALLLDAGRAADAENVYRVDLLQYPKNGWSLFGLARSLRAQGKGGDANYAEMGFENAWERADVTLTASRF